MVKSKIDEVLRYKWAVEVFRICVREWEKCNLPVDTQRKLQRHIRAISRILEELREGDR
jgi:hypothetical protein